jgi:hypothetical protein
LIYANLTFNIVSNFEGISAGPQYMQRSKQMGAEDKDKIRRQALLGVSAGVKGVLLNVYIRVTGMKDVRPFATEAEALAWLAGA